MKTRMFAVCAAVLVCCGTAHAGLSDGLVAYYPFNGNANDESGNSNNGTINGATLTTDRFGNLNNAYNFDGNNNTSIKITSKGFPSGQSAISYSLWVKPKNNENNGFDKRLIEYGGYTNGTSFSLYINSDTYRVDYWGGQYDNFSPIVSNEWQHVVLSHDGISSHSFYLNGILKYSNNHAINLTNSGAAYIGSYKLGNGYSFTGVIDDIRIYNRALSASEVQQLYSGQSTCSNDVVIFTSGTPAKASDVNANFDALKCQIQSLKSIVCTEHPTVSGCP